MLTLETEIIKKVDYIGNDTYTYSVVNKETDVVICFDYSQEGCEEKLKAIVSNLRMEVTNQPILSS